MRWRIALLITLALAGLARGEDDVRRAQLAGATANAEGNLLGDIQAEAIKPGLTVGGFLEKTGSVGTLAAILQQAQQIGGPRWLDEQTCQVRLEIQGAVVARELAQIASSNAKTSPVTGDEVRADLKGWEGRVFSATGASTARIDVLRPPSNSLAWRGVPDTVAQHAVDAARQIAVKRVLDSIAVIPLAGDKKIGDGLANSEVADAMATWLAARPVTMVDFRDDRRVEITLSVTPAAVCEKLRGVLSGRKDIVLPADDKAWGAIADAIAHEMATPVGMGTAVAATQPAVVIVPNQPPVWVEQQLDVEATAGASGSKLRTARQAEMQATGKLLEKIRQLPIASDVTLGAAADGDARLNAAVNRALRAGGHVYKVDYLGDGSVSVRMSMDLRGLWESIVSGQ